MSEVTITGSKSAGPNKNGSAITLSTAGYSVRWVFVSCCMCDEFASMWLDDYSETSDIKGKRKWAYNGDDMSYCPECAAKRV